ncbi:Protein YchQ [wastewater metagenome]|uniref:Protein YchQ n=2 Tax=unclassified sequences TaxID=12908 RepID=A0A5B8RAS4_9ZZZZ|nr:MULTISPECIES: SirB2 family protein [Arhodomonas]MCS4505296.1 SirB2 family protein [Arhodomonas aquaeolei]QEA05038.1 protein YchQ [uncultured organism]
MYMAVKHIHLTTVAITLALFLLRGGWMIAGSTMLQRRWVRILPHVNDTVLLISALWLAISVYSYPMVPHAWITAKIVGLLAYIALGTIALKRGRTFGVRLTAFAGALVVFAYIVHTALTRSPWPF